MIARQVAPLSRLLPKRLLVACLALTAFASTNAAEPLTLASATTPEAAGLYEHLLPQFEQKTGIDIRVIPVGTGQALETGRRGDADVLLLHHPPSEREFVEAGFGVARHPVMYNDFVVVGPRDDPANLRGMTDASAALRRIAETGAPFVSRGDSSGTHSKELALWREASISPTHFDTGWYRELGAGMGATLNMSAAMSAYTLADRGTWLSFQNRRGLELLVEGDRALFNPYAAIRIAPKRHPHVNAKGGARFIQWITSESGQLAIAEYRLRGQIPFHPLAKHKRMPDRRQ